MSCTSSSRKPRARTIEGKRGDYQCNHSSCPVCLEEFEVFAKDKNDRPTQLKPCKHTFHRGCIKQWFISEMKRGKSLLSCPLCRVEIVPKQSLVQKYSGKVYNAAARIFRRGKRSSTDPEDGAAFIVDSFV
mmetsp:Transcript_32944/g.86230  ORF Transcript_32944/g.86230 Transcript_32944/m.86230 type:complete len:131 (+) Transcript_32944:311-703(+)